MGEWVSLEDIHEAFQKEARLNDLRNKFFGNFIQEEDMSNRKKIKAADFSPLQADLVPTFGGFAGRYNGYICEKCDKGWLTLDIDQGVTPMFSPCFATEGCDGQAHSMGYPQGDPPAQLGAPIIHWYKPTEGEFKQLTPELQDHVRRGGLIRKATKDAPEWVKEIL